VSYPERWAILVDRYLAGDCNREELAELEGLLANDPSLKAYLAHAESLRRAGQEYRLSSPRVRSAFDRLQRTLSTADALDRSLDSGNRPKPKAKSLRRLAGVTGLAAAAALLIWLGHVGLSAIIASPPRGWTFATVRGQRSKIALPDGSRVDLAPESRLTFVSAPGSSRQITLVGQAYFSVVHDSRHKFVVHAGNAIFEDVGTRFLVRAYPGDSAVRVVVAEGAVRLAAAAAAGEYVLHSGMMAWVTRGQHGISVAQVTDTASYLAWTSGRLLFQGTPLLEVVADLSRWYGIDIVITDSALERVRIDGPLPAGDRDDALTILASLAHARLVWHGSTAALVARTGRSAAIGRSGVRP